MLRNKFCCQKGLFNMVFFLVFSCVHSVPEISLQYSTPLPCNSQWKNDMQIMHNIAYTWTHGHALTNWQYKPLEFPVFLPPSLLALPDADCVQIAYDTNVRIPPMFVDYVPADALQTRVNKILCSTPTQLREQVTFGNIIIINHFTISIQAVIDNDKHEVKFTVDSDIVVPWFLSPLKNNIISHLVDSIHEYTRTLVLALCMELT